MFHLTKKSGSFKSEPKDIQNKKDLTAIPVYQAWKIIPQSAAHRTVDGVLHVTYGFKDTLDPIINSKRREPTIWHVKPVLVTIIRGSAKAR
jgi:hypothetical protein